MTDGPECCWCNYGERPCNCSCHLEDDDQPARAYEFSRDAIAREVVALRAQLDAAEPMAEEMAKIAEQVGEPDDPFAVWEVIDHLQRQCSKLSAAEEREMALTKLMQPFVDMLDEAEEAIATGERDLDQEGCAALSDREIAKILNPDEARALCLLTHRGKYITYRQLRAMRDALPNPHAKEPGK